MKTETVGLSPKLIAAVIVGLATFAATKLGIQLDPVVEQAINVGAILLAVRLAPPGEVKATEHVPPGGDVEV